MLQCQLPNLPSINKPIFGDEIVLKSIDWLENFPWGKDNSVQSKGNEYEIVLNVKDFAPEEINIKTFEGQLFIEGKHEEKKDDHGLVSRHFVRKYRLPEDCVLEEVLSRMSPEGVLVVTAPRKPVVVQDTIIPVTRADKKCSSKL